MEKIGTEGVDEENREGAEGSEWRQIGSGVSGYRE